MPSSKVRVRAGSSAEGARSPRGYLGYGTLAILGCCLATACLSQGDCPDGGLPFCILECGSDGDCRATEEELDACLIRVCSQGACLTKDACEENEDCVDGECRRTCEDDAGCEDENKCTNDFCREGVCDYEAACGPCQVCDPESGDCSGDCDD